MYSSKDGDILRGVLDLLHYRVNLGFPTFLVKVRAHRGEPYNEAADRIASMSTKDKDVPCLWNAPSDRSIYHFTLTPLTRRIFSTRRQRMALSRNSSRIRQLYPIYTHLAPKE